MRGITSSPREAHRRYVQLHLAVWGVWEPWSEDRRGLPCPCKDTPILPPCTQARSVSFYAPMRVARLPYVRKRSA